MFGMAVVAMIAQRRGSYGLAGAVSAVGLVVLAATSMIVGRMIDQHGQARVALPLLAWSTLWGLAMAVCSWLGAPDWTLYATYGLSAVVATAGTMSRARWTHILGDDTASLHTAMSLEQVLDELSFVLGPAVAVVLATVWFPEAGYLIATALYGFGALLFLTAKSTEPPVVPGSHETIGLAVLNPGIVLLSVVLTLTGVIFGANEVVTMAVAQAAGEASLAGVIVALFAVGSAAAGLWFGAHLPHRGLGSALVVGTFAMCVMEAPILLTKSLPAIGAVMLIAGMATAPTLIISMQLSQRMVPPAQVNEAMSLVLTGMLIGIAAGSALAGKVVDGSDAHLGYVVPVASAALAFVLALIGRGVLTRRASRPSHGKE